MKHNSYFCFSFKSSVAFNDSIKILSFIVFIAKLNFSMMMFDVNSTV